MEYKNLIILVLVAVMATEIACNDHSQGQAKGGGGTKASITLSAGLDYSGLKDHLLGMLKHLEGLLKLPKADLLKPSFGIDLSFGSNAKKSGQVVVDSHKVKEIPVYIQEVKTNQEATSIVHGHHDHNGNYTYQNNGHVVIKEKPIIREHTVTEEKPVIQEHTIYKDRPIITEHTVIKEKPIIQEHTLIKQKPIIKQHVVIKERPIIKEHVIVKEQPIFKEHVVIKESPTITDEVVVQEKPTIITDEVIVQEKPTIIKDEVVVREHHAHEKHVKYETTGNVETIEHNNHKANAFVDINTHGHKDVSDILGKKSNINANLGLEAHASV